MKTRNLLTMILVLLMCLLLLAGFAGTLDTVKATQTIVELKWTNPMAVNDVAVSDDGSHVAAVNGTGLYYFDATSPTPIWWYTPATAFLSVAISTDGDSVVAGASNSTLHYFNQSTTRAGLQLSPTWMSHQMGGPIEKGTMDMSANGNYTVVGGTGVNTWYYANCLKRTGTDEAATWISFPGVVDFKTVHVSPDGNYVAGGGSRSGGGFVVFFKNATQRIGYTSPTWFAESQIDATVLDLALSDDGFAVASISAAVETLRYWANATTLSGDPNATWTNPGDFTSIDMSLDGDYVVAGGSNLRSLHYWSHGRVREGVEPEDWVRLDSVTVPDVAMSRDGTIIAAPVQTQNLTYRACFFKSDATMIGNFSLLEQGSMVSMSGDGATVAIAGPGLDSLYLFKTFTDSTPPQINDVYQQPAEDNVTTQDRVRVFANITDDGSGVKDVLLGFTNGNGTWFTQQMEPYRRDIWNGTIPAYPYLTNVTYKIIAQDNANNTATSETSYTLEYQIILEYPTALLAPLLLATTTTMLALKKRRQTKNI